MDLLEQVLCRTESRGNVTIVSENHDTKSINWVAGLTDPGEMISCGYLPQIRRMANEQDREYAERITPIVMTLPKHDRDRIMGAAIQRAALDTTTGKVAVVVVGEPAWHKLGVNVADALTAADAIRLASLDWAVEKRAMYYRDKDGNYRSSEDTFAIVRADSDAQLGTVGSRYRPIQNADGFSFLDDVIGEHGAKYHTAGAIYGGAKVWMQCELPQQSFEVVRGDRVDCYAVFSNPHDGSGKAYCFPTSNRIVCANTFRVASADKDKGLGIRHTGDVKASIADAQRSLGLAVTGFGRFAEAATEMARRPVDSDQFFGDLLDVVLDVTAAEALKGADALAAAIAVTEAGRELAAKTFQRQIDARKNVLEDILQRYDSDRCGIGGIRGTQWGVFNAVTEHADHAKKRMIGTPEARLSRRFESVLNGDADEIKQTAYQMLTMKA